MLGEPLLAWARTPFLPPPPPPSVAHAPAGRFASTPCLASAPYWLPPLPAPPPPPPRPLLVASAARPWARSPAARLWARRAAPVGCFGRRPRPRPPPAGCFRPPPVARRPPAPPLLVSSVAARRHLVGRPRKTLSVALFDATRRHLVGSYAWEITIAGKLLSHPVRL
nr:atherin-like [Aegilops tauschii subsp. strangulata]